MKVPKGFAVAALAAGVIAIAATLPMFGCRPGIAFIVFALPALSVLSPMFGNVHTHVAVATLLVSWVIYLALFLFLAKIVRVLRGK